MLFIHSNSLALFLDEATRLRLLDALAARVSAPLIRSARRRRFELLMNDQVDVATSEAAWAEFERECLAQRESAGESKTGGSAAYTPGEIFCTGDCVLFLVFGAGAEDGLSTGIVFNVGTPEPLLKLDRFCRDVREALLKIRKGDAEAADGETFDLPCWKTRTGGEQQRSSVQHGLARFIAIQPTDFAIAARLKGGGREFMRATELIAEQPVRQFLRRVQEMRREGYTPRRLFAEAGAHQEQGGVSIERMLEAGLLEREVRVSCRKSGHALFDLPTPDALAAITISKAKCSLCAAPVADEVVEETINPTRLAVSLLEDGGWLNNRVYQIVRSLGVPESEIATGATSAHGESSLAAEVCGNSYLFVTKDGDLTPAVSRRIIETVTETEATHLVVVVTGQIEDEGRLRLYEFAWRRARGGHDLDTALIEGLETAHAEIKRSFERALYHQLSRQLFTLDRALGFSASNFVLDWFKLKQTTGADKHQPANVLMPRFTKLDQRIAS